MNSLNDMKFLFLVVAIFLGFLVYRLSVPSKIDSTTEVIQSNDGFENRSIEAPQPLSLADSSDNESQPSATPLKIITETPACLTKPDLKNLEMIHKTNVSEIS